MKYLLVIILALVMNGVIQYVLNLDQCGDNTRPVAIMEVTRG